jgi:hypothetical protein
MIGEPIYIYIAGPYTKGDSVINVRRAAEAASTLRHGVYHIIPFVPHLYHLWDLIEPNRYGYWMDMCFAWIDKCDALLRLP